MTIKTITAYKTPDGKIWENERDAQWHEAEYALRESKLVKELAEGSDIWTEEAVTELLIMHRKTLLPLLRIIEGDRVDE